MKMQNNKLARAVAERLGDKEFFEADRPLTKREKRRLEEEEKRKTGLTKSEKRALAAERDLPGEVKETLYQRIEDGLNTVRNPAEIDLVPGKNLKPKEIKFDYSELRFLSEDAKKSALNSIFRYKAAFQENFDLTDEQAKAVAAYLSWFVHESTVTPVSNSSTRHFSKLEELVPASKIQPIAEAIQREIATLFNQ